MNACPTTPVRPEPAPPVHQAFHVAIDGSRFHAEPVQATPNAPLPRRFCGLSMDTRELMGMAAAHYAQSYAFYHRNRVNPAWPRHLIEDQRKTLARALMAVVAAACTSDSSDLQRMRYARRNILQRARHARYDLGLRDVGAFLKDAKFTKGHCDHVREVIKLGGAR